MARAEAYAIGHTPAKHAHHTTVPSLDMGIGMLTVERVGVHTEYDCTVHFVFDTIV